MRRRFTIGSVVFLAIVFSIYTGGWFWLADEVVRQTERSIAAAAADGIEVSMEPPEITGYPFGFHVNANNVDVHGVDGTSLRGESVRAGVDVAALRTATWSIGGPIAAQVPVNPDLPLVDVTVNHAEGRATAGLDGELEAAAVRIDGVAVGNMPVGEITVARADVDLERLTAENGDISHDFSADIASIGLSPALALFGTEISSVRADLVLTGSPPRQMRAGDLTRWRDSGGTLFIDHAHLAWGPVRIRLEGRVELDQNLQPQGNLTIEVYGEGAIIDQAIRHGVVGQFEAGALRFALGALTRPDEAGQMRLLAPLRVAGGRLSLGQIQLPVALPPVNWPQ